MSDAAESAVDAAGESGPEDGARTTESAGEPQAAEAPGEPQAPEPDGEAETIEPAPALDADEVLLGSVPLAQRALLEVTAPETVGSVIGNVAEGEHVLSLHFAADLSGYPGWHWSVTLARVEDGEPTVLETELLPGERALLAPEWVPWSERLADYRAAQAAAAAEAAERGEGEDADEAEPGDEDLAEESDAAGESDDEEFADADDEEFADADDADDDVFDGIDIDALADDDAEDSDADGDDADDDGDDEDD